jgi:hypothetical protein
MPISGTPMKFELDNLDSYDDASILSEIRRVGEVVGDRRLTRRLFDSHSKVSSSTVVRRFGSWEQALRGAGLSSHYSGRTVSERMRTQQARSLSNDELLAELRRVSALNSQGVITRAIFDQQAICNSAALEDRFGSWGKAVSLAGAVLSPLGRRHSNEDYFENLLTVWTHHGRQPLLREMDAPPSRITSGGYEAKFGGWRKALRAFVDQINGRDEPNEPSEPRASQTVSERSAPSDLEVNRSEVPAKLSLKARYDVLTRDSFRCTICGRSPAMDLGVILHVDHVVARSRGGNNVASNLRTLCLECNLGKGAR